MSTVLIIFDGSSTVSEFKAISPLIRQSHLLCTFSFGMTKKHSSVKEEAKKKNVKDLQGRQSGKPTSPVTAVGPENNVGECRRWDFCEAVGTESMFCGVQGMLVVPR